MDKKKILVVDDELFIRLLAKGALEKDYAILEANDGEEAIAIARHQKPALILMDIMMPKLDGIGACYILKSDIDTREIPVIMVSVRTDKLDQDYSRGMGADDYLTKPFSVQALQDKVSQYELTRC